MKKKGVAFAEPEFFEIFNFPLVSGDQKNALREQISALITEHIAKKYFGTENPIGKIIRYTFSTTTIDCKITGILRDLPNNTDRKQEIYISYINLKDRDPRLGRDDNWVSVRSSMQCFVLLNPGVTKSDVEKVFPLFKAKYLSPADAKVTQFKLQPLSDIHFNTDYDGYADKKYLWALACIGIFLIITACVNFVNMATAQALNRSKEVGVRKVLGSPRLQLFWQFIAETSVITMVAAILAFGLAQLVLPYLNNLFETKMTVNLFTNWQLVIFLVILLVSVVFLSGFYPGLVITRFQPVVALKGKLSQKNIGGFSLRRVLVVIQFAISQMLIIGTIVIASQMHFSKTSDLGFNKDGIVMLPIPLTDSIGKIRMLTLKNRLETLAGVGSISFCSDAPASEHVHATDVTFGTRAKSEPYDVSIKTADDQYVKTFGIKLVAGRNVFPTDTVRELLVNETLVKNLV